MRFPSKKDVWASAMLWLVTFLMFAQSGFIIILSTMAPIPLPWVVLLVAVPLFLGVLLISIFFWTGYEITAEHFVVRMGLFHFQIPLERIARVATTRAIFTPAWGFALSFDRLHVWYRKKNGKVAWLPIAVSPADKAEFLLELARAFPNLQMDE